MIRKYLTAKSQREVLDVLIEVEKRFDPYEMDYERLYGAINLSNAQEVWNALDLAGLGSTRYVGGTPCIDNGYYLEAIEFGGTILVYANSSCVNYWYCCLAQVDNNIELWRLVSHRGRLYPESIHAWPTEQFYEAISNDVTIIDSCDYKDGEYWSKYAMRIPEEYGHSEHVILEKDGEGFYLWDTYDVGNYHAHSESYLPAEVLSQVVSEIGKGNPKECFRIAERDGELYSLWSQSEGRIRDCFPIRDDLPWSEDDDIVDELCESEDSMNQCEKD